MSKAKRSIPIFPLGPEAVWEDVLNAIEASVQYQSEHGGKFGPLFAFAPMTEPENPDQVGTAHHYAAEFAAGLRLAHCRCDNDESVRARGTADRCAGALLAGFYRRFKMGGHGRHALREDGRARNRSLPV